MGVSDGLSERERSRMGMLVGALILFAVPCGAQTCAQEMVAPVVPYAGPNGGPGVQQQQADTERIRYRSVGGSRQAYVLYIAGRLQIEPADGSAPYTASLPPGETYGQFVNQLCSGQISLPGPSSNAHEARAAAQPLASTAPNTATASVGSEGTVSAVLTGGGQVVAWVSTDSLDTAIVSADGSTYTTSAQYPVGPNAQNVVAADFNGDGNADFAVSDFGNLDTDAGGDIQILFGNGAGTFTAGPTVNAGTTPVAMYAADFNGDGKLDLAVANLTSGTVSVLLGNGNGTFQAPVAYTVDNANFDSPQSVIAADFNGDGHMDIAVANQSGSISVLMGNGDGTFQPSVSYPGGSLSATYLASMDLNEDGKADLIVANDSSNAISFILGNGDGSFQTPQLYVTGAIPEYFALAPATDGALIVTVDAVAPNLVAIPVSSSGVTASPPMYPLSQRPTGIAAADINGDGLPDMIAADGQISVLLRNPAAGFNAAVNYPLQSGSQAAAVAAGDLNGDGKPDVVAASVASGGAGTVDVALNQGNGTLGSQSSYAIGGYPGGYGNGGGNSIAMGDFNGDGHLDVAVGYQSAGGTAGGISVLLGTGSGTLQPAVNYAVGNFPVDCTVAGDFNGDGKLDLAACAGTTPATPGAIGILLGNGNGTFQNAVLTQVGSPAGFPIALASGDVNGDGKPDLVAAVLDNNANTSIIVLLGNGNGTFRQLAPIASPAEGEALALLDLNGDGIPDLVVGDQIEGVYLLGKGDGTFQTPQYFSSGSLITAFAVADWDANGIPGLAIAQAHTVMAMESSLYSKVSTPPPSPTIASVKNAASQASGSYAPGESIIISGSNLGPSPGADGTITNGKLSTSVSGVSVTVNGTAAPLGYVSATEIEAVIPYEVAGSKSASLVVSYNGAQSAKFPLAIDATAPGLFTTNGEGSGPVIASNGASLNSASNPAAAGDVLVIYGTGEGQLKPAGVTGQITGGSGPAIAASVSVRIGNVAIPGADIQYAGEVADTVEGVFELKLLLPSGLPSGNDNLVVTIGGVSTQGGVTVAIR